MVIASASSEGSNNLRIRAVSPDPSLHAYTKYRSSPEPGPDQNLDITAHRIRQHGRIKESFCVNATSTKSRVLAHIL